MVWILLGPAAAAAAAAVPVGFENIVAAAAAGYFECVNGWVVAIVDSHSGQRKDRKDLYLHLQCCRY